jgi:hypothetical protein
MPDLPEDVVACRFFTRIGMTSSTRSKGPEKNPVAWALYVNAAVLAVILLILIGRRSQSSPRSAFFEQPAYGQMEASARPLAGGSGLFLMPSQLSTNTWGCYVLDANAQTLTAYQYYPGDKVLRLVAGRNIRFDRQLSNYQTQPDPEEVRRMVEEERQSGMPATQKSATQPQ